MTERRHVVFAGGGTGGHLFPGLAVAEQLMRENAPPRITFAGTGKKLERRLVETAGFAYSAFHCHPAPKRIREIIPFVADNMTGYRAASRFLREEKVDLVVGLGGYASVPTARAAIRRRIPLILLEQNVVPGRATRWLAGSAAAICTSFEDTLAYFRSTERIHHTGNPIRVAEFADASPTILSFPTQTPNRRRLVVLGGSGGAKTLNQAVPSALRRLKAALHGWQIVHQSGETDLEATRRRYLEFGVEAEVVAFIEDMPALLAGAAAAVCRAGGTTLAELAAAGVPAVLIPYPFAADDHQRANAEVFASSGGCVLVDEVGVNGRFDVAVARHLWPLLTDEAIRTAMAEAIRKLGRPEAAVSVVHTIRSLAA